MRVIAEPQESKYLIEYIHSMLGMLSVFHINYDEGNLALRIPAAFKDEHADSRCFELFVNSQNLVLMLHESYPGKSEQTPIDSEVPSDTDPALVEVVSVPLSNFIERIPADTDTGSNLVWSAGAIRVLTSCSKEFKDFVWNQIQIDKTRDNFVESVHISKAEGCSCN